MLVFLMNTRTKEYLMFPNRHPHEDVIGLTSIYKNSKVDYPFDYKGMEKEAKEFFEKEDLENTDVILIYITGLTSALICIFNVLREMNIHTYICVMHYNKDTGHYISQYVNI